VVRSSDLHRFFWEQTAEVLRLRDTSISVSGWGTSHRVVVTGRATVFALETGAYWEGSGQSSVQYSFAAVSLSGLPGGLSIDGQISFSTAVREVVSCDEGRVRTVTLDAVPVQLGGLRLEQVSVDLQDFLTPERRDAICSIRGNLKWIAGGHQIEQRIREDPYPEKRVLSAAMSGDPVAVEAMREHRDRIVTLVESVLADASTATRELGIGLPDNTSE